MTATCARLGRSLEQREDSLTSALCISYTVHYVLLAALLVSALCPVTQPVMHQYAVDLQLLPSPQPTVGTTMDSAVVDDTKRKLLAEMSPDLSSATENPPAVTKQPIHQREAVISDAPPSLRSAVTPEREIVASAPNPSLYQLHAPTPIATPEVTASEQSTLMGSTSSLTNKQASEKDSDAVAVPLSEITTARSEQQSTENRESQAKTLFLPTIGPFRANSFGTAGYIAVQPVVPTTRTDRPDKKETREVRYLSGCGPDFSDYMAKLQRLVQLHWYPPKCFPPRTILAFRVNKDGTIAELKVTKSAGIKMADDAALKAVEDAAPFPPLPEGAPDFVSIDLTLDYAFFMRGRKTLNDPQ